MKKSLLLGIGIVVVLALGWWLASPLFINDVVDEPFPVVNTQPVEQVSPSQKEVVEVQQEETVEETTEPNEGKPLDIIEGEDVIMDEDMLQEAVGLVSDFSGQFQDADRSHKGSGDALVIGDVLRFENFDVTNGPDLRVYLATDDSASDFIDLGELKGNQGNQNYDIPPGTDLETYDTVLIWCRAFSVLFSTAELS